jgi:hypothetical protein
MAKPSSNLGISQAFRRERRAKNSWFSKSDHRWRGLAVITVIYFRGAWVDFFISHYLKQDQADVYIINLSGHRDLQLNVSGPDNDRINVLDIPCDSFDDWTKAYMLEMFSSMLRMQYTYTVVADVDELVFAYSRQQDRFIPSITSALKEVSHQPVIRCLGLNVLEFPDSSPLDASRPISLQRRYAHPVSPLNKPCIMGDYHLVLPGQHFTDTGAPCGYLSSQSASHDSYLFCLLHLKHACRSLNHTVRESFSEIRMSRQKLEDYYSVNSPPGYTDQYIERLNKLTPQPLSSDLMCNYLEAWNMSLIENPWKDLFTRYTAPAGSAKFLVELPSMQESVLHPSRLR